MSRADGGGTGTPGLHEPGLLPHAEPLAAVVSFGRCGGWDASAPDTTRVVPGCLQMAKLSNGCLLLLCVAVTASPALAGRSRWDRELFAQLQLQQRVREPAMSSDRNF